MLHDKTLFSLTDNNHRRALPGARSNKNGEFMKAILCKEYGPAETLVIEDVPSPEVKGRGVKVRVKAAGLNFPDTLIIENKETISSLQFFLGSLAVTRCFIKNIL